REQRQAENRERKHERDHAHQDEAALVRRRMRGRDAHQFMNTANVPTSMVEPVAVRSRRSMRTPRSLPTIWNRSARESTIGPEPPPPPVEPAWMSESEASHQK